MQFLKKLFENPGKKVKTLALIVFCVLVIGSVVGTIIIGASFNWKFVYYVYSYATDYSTRVINWKLIGAVVGTPIGGLILAWASSVLPYAFGDMVEDISILRKKGSENGEKKPETKALPEL